MRHAGDQCVTEVFECRFEVLLCLQLLLRPGQAWQGARFFCIEQFQCLLRCIKQGLGVGQSGVLGVEFFPLVIAGREFFHLCDLPLQSLAVTLQVVLCAACLGQCLLCGAPLRPVAGHLILHGNAGVSVQQTAHCIGARQALPGMLSVDVQQVLAHCAQLGGSGRYAIDPCAALALQIYGAPQQQVFIGSKTCLL